MEEQNTTVEKVQDEEITLKVLILKLKEYYKECKGNWKTILLFVIPFVGYQLYLRLTMDSEYPASLTFMINDSKGTSVGGLLGQFQGLVGADDDKLEKILELAKSRKTIGAAILQKGVIGEKNDYYANHLIRIQNLQADWKKDSLLNGFYFTRSNMDSFTLRENRALRQLHQVLVGNETLKPLFTTGSNKKTGIMFFSLKTQNEELTLKLIKAMYQSLSNFYIESTVRKEQETYNILRAKRDSIQGVLYGNDIATAKHDDQNNNLLSQIDKVPAKRYFRNNQLLTTMYAEIIKNTEFAEFALKTATPFITSIDEPIPPLKPIRYGRLKNLIIFSALGVFLSLLFIIVRKIFQDALK